jgi:hypothetical protein
LENIDSKKASLFYTGGATSNPNFLYNLRPENAIVQGVNPPLKVEEI